ncbi:hypothetical protein PF011_g4098 [Phytophthora fragariae]|uniref:Uncharacterized protein n=1 Tax=Phytophthora fragariae TaxID=53985 RepID=A0A6A3LV31_9STRA|nr:hypothetical protein PF011_g4098 [Phytophthora fragariae]
MATLVLNLATIRFVYARAIGQRLGSIDSTNRVRKLRLELTILKYVFKLSVSFVSMCFQMHV